MNRFVIRLIAAVAAALAIMSLTEAAGARAPADPSGGGMRGPHPAVWGGSPAHPARGAVEGA